MRMNAMRSRWFLFIFAWILKTNAEKPWLNGSITPISEFLGRGELVIFRKCFKNVSTPKFVRADPKKTGENYSYSMVGDHARVYKGGSWIDPQYYAAPGQRRWMEEDESAKNIGFRCAMARLGTPSGGGVTR